MQISVELTPNAAAAFRVPAGADDAAREVRRAAEELGIELRALHEEGSDPLLSRFFHAMVDDADEAARIVERLQRTRGVEAAFIKPHTRLA